jgi:la-related protein 1
VTYSYCPYDPPCCCDENTLPGQEIYLLTIHREYYFSVENLCKDIFLRKHMDSKGFVFLSVIAEFNRIKQLTTDLELIKLVCYQSPSIDFFVGHDGKDRLRARKGWAQWVMSMSERDLSAQNDGPEELHNPPTPHPQGFEQGFPGDIHGAGSSPHPMTNGVSNGVPVNPAEDIRGTGSDGYPIESSKAVSDDSDSFSDQQVETLSVIVRKQDQAPVLPPSAIRTFSNGSIDSRSDPLDEPDKVNGQLSASKVNGISSSQG